MSLETYTITIKAERCRHGREEPHRLSYKGNYCPGPEEVDIGTFQAKAELIERWKEAVERDNG